VQPVSAAGTPATDAAEAARFLTLLDESADSFSFRVFDDNEKRKDPSLAAKYSGTLADLLPTLQAKQAQGCGVYVVANAGEQTNDTIYRVRVVFADTDGAPLEPILACGLEPHFVVESSPGKWHVYWLVDGLPLNQFRDVQRSIAAQFGTDKSVNDLARVMRLPGLLHLKGAPFLVRIIHESGGLPYSADTILEHFAPTAIEASAPSPGLDSTVLADRHADVLKCTLLLAQAIRAGAITRQEAFDAMRYRRDAGRWTRHVPDEEITRALDGALQKGGHVTEAPNPVTSLAHDVAQALTPLSIAELDAARVPHAHAFMSPDGKTGLFPVGEVTVIGAPGREGKTSVVMSVAMHYALGWSLANMAPAEIKSVIIYSAEDDREQYGRKAGAQYSQLAVENAERFRKNLLIPDLHGPGIAAWREIVRMDNRQPARGIIVEPLIDAINGLAHHECPPGLVIFETASTLSDADEDNPGHKAMIATLKHIAKRTGVAVVLVHHTSQNAANNLPELNISEADIRGGTTLVNNARQTHLLVNLASSRDPFPDSDARTLLRTLVAQGESERVTTLICLSSSKCAEPAPLFFRWNDTLDYGPRLVEIAAPAGVAGKSWRAVRGLLSGARAEIKADKKAEARQASVRLCVRTVHDLAEKGEQPTVRKVSTAAGYSPGWAKPYLDAAVEGREIMSVVESIPGGKGMADIYRPLPDAKPWQAVVDGLSMGNDASSTQGDNVE
jgi:hypothetical protein